MIRLLLCAILFHRLRLWACQLGLHSRVGSLPEYTALVLPHTRIFLTEIVAVAGRTVSQAHTMLNDGLVWTRFAWDYLYGQSQWNTLPDAMDSHDHVGKARESNTLTNLTSGISSGVVLQVPGEVSCSPKK